MKSESKTMMLQIKTWHLWDLWASWYQLLQVVDFLIWFPKMELVGFIFWKKNTQFPEKNLDKEIWNLDLDMGVSKNSGFSTQIIPL